MTDGAVERVLVVCSANQCRSPLAAAFLGDRLARLGIGARVVSAGTHALGGTPATEATRVAAARFGLDLSSHRSRAVTTPLVQGADLVLVMEREHLRQIVVADPSVFPRAFTLKELVRRGAAVTDDGEDMTPAARVARLHAGRRSTDLLGASIEDDVEDPTGSRFADHETTAREVSELVDRAVPLVWGRALGER